MLGVGVDWVRRRVASKSIPHVKLGRRVRFTDAHVQTIIDRHTVTEDVAPVTRRRARIAKFSA